MSIDKLSSDRAVIVHSVNNAVIPKLTTRMLSTLDNLQIHNGDRESAAQAMHLSMAVYEKSIDTILKTYADAIAGTDQRTNTDAIIQVFYCYYMKMQSIEQTAVVMGVSKQVVRAYIRRINDRFSL